MHADILMPREREVCAVGGVGQPVCCKLLLGRERQPAVVIERADLLGAPNPCLGELPLVERIAGEELTELELQPLELDLLERIASQSLDKWIAIGDIHRRPP